LTPWQENHNIDGNNPIKNGYPLTKI